MPASGLGDLQSSEHPREFLHPLVALQRPDLAAHLAGDLGLAHLPLPVGCRRHLRQVSDAHHLVGLSQLLEHPADDLGHAPADPSIHLVEDQRRHLGHRGGDGLDRQTETRKLATRSHLGQRAQSGPGVGGHQQLHLLQTVRAARLHGRERDLEAPAGHGQPLHLLGHALAQFRSGAQAFARQPLRGLPVGLRRRDFLLLQLLRASRTAQRFETFLQPHQGLRQVLRHDTVLAGSGVHLLQPLLHFLQTARVEVDACEVVAQAIDRFLDLDLRRLQYVEALLEPGIVLGRRVQARNDAPDDRKRRGFALGQCFQRVLDCFLQARCVAQAPVLGL